jgi:hypothetical protein
MVGRKEVEPLQRVTLNLFQTDYEAMQVAYNVIGPQKAIRNIIRAHVKRLRQRAANVELEAEDQDD